MPLVKRSARTNCSWWWWWGGALARPDVPQQVEMQFSTHTINQGSLYILYYYIEVHASIHLLFVHWRLFYYYFYYLCSSSVDLVFIHPLQTNSVSLYCLIH